MANYEREFNLCCVIWRKKNRGPLEIIASILEAVKNNGTSRYSLMTQIGSNSAALKKYLKSLTEMGFIETNIKDGQILYRASEKGLDFLRQYYVLLGKMLSMSACGNIVLTKHVKVREP